MSNYPPDPGGVFASDHHRRVAAHLPLPDEDAASVDDLLVRLHDDAHTPIWGREEDREPLVRFLDDLQETGDARHLDGSDGWRLTKEGLARLTGPALTEVATPEHLRRRLAANLGGEEPADEASVEKAIAEGEKAGTIVVQDIDDDGNVLLYRFEALPLTGARLGEMEAHDERIAAEDAEIDRRVAAQAVDDAEKALATAKAFAEEVAA